MKVAVYENALDLEVYRACIKSLKTHVPTPGVVGKSLNEARVDDARIADVRYLKDTMTTELLSDFMKEPYGDLTAEPLQVITYGVGGNYKWHVDGSGEGYRKYTFVSVLSPKDQYKGGELEIDGITLPECAFDPFTIIIFNPALRHRVKPVTEGVRHSLVTWFHK